MDIVIEKNVHLSAYTTLKVGGVADYFVVVKSKEDLVAALLFAQQTAMPPLIIGGGSNLLISDDGYRGLVILNEIKGREFTKNGNEIFLTCGAGEILDEVIEDAVQQGFWGLENLSAIPGTVGATPIQNVGAYGVEVSTLIAQVVAVHCLNLEERKFSNEECQFGYRDSYFKSEVGQLWVVVGVTLVLSTSPNPKLDYGSLQSLVKDQELSAQKIRKEICEIRASKFPNWREVGTAGSFFKNPVISISHFEILKKQHPDLVGFANGDNEIKVSLGWILDHVCKLRGYCENGICLYEKQALVLVNVEGKEARVIEEFANHIAEIVEEKTGIRIEREVRSI